MATQHDDRRISDDGWFTVTDDTDHVADTPPPPAYTPPAATPARRNNQTPFITPRPTPILNAIKNIVASLVFVFIFLVIFGSILKNRPPIKHTPPPVIQNNPPPVYSPPPTRQYNNAPKKKPTKKNVGTVRIGPWPSKDAVKKILEKYRRPARRRPSDWDDAPPPKVRRRYRNRNRYNNRVQEQDGSSPPVNRRSGDEYGWY